MATKTCRACGETKPIEQFHLHKQMADGRLTKCKACTAAQCREYEKTHRAECRNRRAAWRAANPDRWKEIQRRSYEKDKASGALAAKSARYRGRKPKNIVDLAAIYERDKGVCHICTQPVAKDLAHYDHVVPLILGGEHSEANLKVAHHRCNSWKAGRLMSELVGQQPPAVDLDWERRVKVRARELRSESMKRAWKEKDWTARNAKIAAGKLGVKRPDIAAAMKGNTNGKFRKNRVLSEDARRRISEAQKARWASGAYADRGTG